MSTVKIPDTVSATTATDGAFTIHVGLTKHLLLTLLEQHGAGAVLRDWPGTDAEAAAAIGADPREVFVLSPYCPRQHPDGSCACAPKSWGGLL